MKFSCVYVEKDVLDTPRVQDILSRIQRTPVVTIERFGEVFNRRSQNFRLQKGNPALILARKHGKLVLPAPVGYGFNDYPSYYFSHMLNCVYDCRYCFLQGMYRSANYVLFVNFEEFTDQMQGRIDAQQGSQVFYSGYDCDSLALEPISGFSEHFVDWFARHPEVTLEIRTKSTQVRNLIAHQPLSNVVIAMSFTPQEVFQQWEDKVPGIEKRIDALKKLQDSGWPVAIRLEPLIHMPDIEKSYESLLADLFAKLDPDKIHSVSTGMFRMPKAFFKNIVDLYPDEALYARAYEQREGMISQSLSQEIELFETVERLLFRYIPEKHYYRCA